MDLLQVDYSHCYPRVDAEQLQKAIPQILGEIDDKSRSKLPERKCIGAIAFYKCST